MIFIFLSRIHSTDKVASAAIQKYLYESEQKLPGSGEGEQDSFPRSPLLGVRSAQGEGWAWRWETGPRMAPLWLAVRPGLCLLTSQELCFLICHQEDGLNLGPVIRPGGHSSPAGNSSPATPPFRMGLLPAACKAHSEMPLSPSCSESPGGRATQALE